MLTKAQILSDPQIADFLKKNQGSSREIERAAELLSNKNDAIPAARKLLPALSQKEVRVFFSYKRSDTKAADTIVGLLRGGAGNLKISYMNEFRKDIGGKKYREYIREKIREANWFILLLPDPSVDWDWCLFETGLFEAQLTSADRLICLHHPDIKLPSPIADYEDIPAIKSEVEKFLSMAFVNDNPIYGLEALNRYKDKEIPEIAGKIVEAIVPPIRRLDREVFEPWLELRIPNAEKMTRKEDLDEALIVSANRAALEIFGFQVEPKTLGQLRSGLSQQSPEDSRWLSELYHVIRRIAAGRIFFPIQAVLQKWDGKMYHPVLCAIDRKEDHGSIETYHVTFTEEVGSVDDSAMPREVSELATIVRFAFRFKWEVLQKFGGKTLTEDDLIRVDNSFKRIQKDWESRGVTADDSFIRLFPPDKARRITEMLAYWRTKKNYEGSGELDTAIKNKETALVSSILKEFIPFSQEFLEIATERFAQQASSQGH